MKLTEEQLNSIKEFAKQECSNNDLWHQVYHLEITAKWAEYLAKKEGVDINRSIVAAWLHDITKHKHTVAVNHSTSGAKMARPFLENLGFSKEDIDDICHAIHMHNKNGEKSKVAQVVYDADKIQTVGPYGFARVFGAWTNGLNKNQEEAYTGYLKDIAFFLPQFHTKTAKKIRDKQMKIMEEFHNQYKDIEKLRFK